MPNYWLLTLIVLVVLIILNGIRSTLVTVAILLVVQYYIQSTTSAFSNKLTKLPILSDEISKYNESSLDSILSSTYQDADTALSDSFIENGKKSKTSMDIRSHLNNDNWKKYYDYEFNTISGENRDWWSNDDLELSKRHDISAFY